MSTNNTHDRIREFAEFAQQLPVHRKTLLSSAAEKMHNAASEGQELNLLFVCTHNSRRSQFGQFWAAVLIHSLQLVGLRSFSCGTEATECNIRTIQSLERSGASIDSSVAETNPHYTVRLDNLQTTLFSKAFGDPTLPANQIIAMMCCDDADERCPTVPGAIARTALHYRDPKISDGTPEEAATYDERSLQIATEMTYLLSAYKQHLHA